MIVLAFDPGLSGAVAFVKHTGEATVHDLPTIDLPGNGTVRRRIHGPSLARLIRSQCPVGEPVEAFTEDLSAGGRDSSAQTVGSQYRTRGTIECCIEMLGLELRPVNVRTWKGYYQLPKDKSAALETARVLFPDLAGQLARVGDHNRAEALLIARYGLKKALA